MGDLKSATTPILITAKSANQIIFSYIVDRVEGQDIWDEYDDVVSFIKQSHTKFIERYSHQPELSRIFRQVDPRMLASDMLSAIEHNPCGGAARLNLSFMAQLPDDQSYFSLEYPSYTVHWFEASPDQVMTVVPIGFQCPQHYRGNENVLVSTCIFDTSVTDKKIEDSMEYFHDYVASKLDPYFTHLEKVYTSINKDKVPVDFEDVKTHFNKCVVDIYNRRLLDPTHMERDVVKLDAIFIGQEDKKCHFSMHIRLDTYVTTTPELSPTHPDYKTMQIAKDQFYKTFNAMEPQLKAAENPGQMPETDMAVPPPPAPPPNDPITH